MRRPLWMFVLGGLLICGAGPGAAQEPAPRHDGFWIGFGVGGGWNLTQDIFGNSLAGGSAWLRMGGSPNEHFLVGGEANAWARREGNTTMSRGNATFTALFYPQPKTGLFLKGGVGFAGVTLESSSTIGNTTATVTTTRGGFGTTWGVGWDVRLGRNFYIVPSADFMYQRIEGANNTILVFSLGALWH